MEMGRQDVYHRADMDCTSKEISVSVLASTQTMKKKKMAQKYL
jgi:hypothetical protein